MNRKGLTAAPANDSASVMGTCARIVGVADRPIQSQKFSGPGCERIWGSGANRTVNTFAFKETARLSHGSLAARSTRKMSGSWSPSTDAPPLTCKVLLPIAPKAAGRFSF